MASRSRARLRRHSGERRSASSGQIGTTPLLSWKPRGGFPILPATGLVGQSPPEAHASRRMPTAALRASMARSASGASRDQQSWSPAPSRTRWQPSADARCASSTPLRSRPYPARAPSLRSRRVSPLSRRFPSVSVTRARPFTESDGAQGEGHVPTVGVRSCSGRLRTDAKRRPRATWAGLPARSRSSDGRGMSFPRCSRPRAEAERRSPESRVRLPEAPTASAQWRHHRNERSCPPSGQRRNRPVSFSPPGRPRTCALAACPGTSLLAYRW